MSSLEDYFASLYAEAAVAGGGTGQATATITPPSLPGAGLAESRPQTNVGVAAYAAPAPSSTMTLDQFLATQQPADYYGMGEPVRNNYLQPQAQPAEPPMTQEEFDYGLLQLGATPYAAGYTEEQIYALRSAVGQAQDAALATGQPQSFSPYAGRPSVFDPRNRPAGPSGFGVLGDVIPYNLSGIALSALAGGPLAPALDIGAELNIPGIDPLLDKRKRLIEGVTEADVPVYSEFARETVRPAVRRAVPGDTFLDNLIAALVPTQTGEIALE